MRMVALLGVVVIVMACDPPGNDEDITAADIAAAEKLVGLQFQHQERRLMLDDVRERHGAYEALRAAPLSHDTAPVVAFHPALLTGWQPQEAPPPEWQAAAAPDTDDYAWLSVAELGAALRAGLVTSEELTRYFIARLRAHDDTLKTVVTYTEERALAQARRADAELAAGKARGPLHGIPYGAKDLFAVPGYPTTWGTTPFREQVLDQTATVIRRLDDAGAVLVAKLSLGELAWGDVWFGGRTRNPWNPDTGASGSSAGSAAAVAAGLLPFALGTETWGSLVTPATRNGVTALRPTYGRVSRHGAMALAWSMDKVGPLCRHVQDCVQVLAAIQGPDGHDRSVVEAPLPFRPRSRLDGLRLGFLADELQQHALDAAALQRLRELGATLVPVTLPDMDPAPLALVLAVEAATVFDTFTRERRTDQMLRQERNAWPNVFRAARLVPAVEYLRAQRLRQELLAGVEAMAIPVDAWLAPATRGDNLLATNLSGHPCVALPAGFDGDGIPHGITVCARLYGEAAMLAVAEAYQRATDWHTRRPPGFGPD